MSVLYHLKKHQSCLCPPCPPDVFRKHKHPCRSASYSGAPRLLIFLHIATVILDCEFIPSAEIHTKTLEKYVVIMFNCFPEKSWCSQQINPTKLHVLGSMKENFLSDNSSEK